MTIHILLADDHALMRAGLRKLIEDFPDCEIVGEAVNGHEAVRLVRELAPDLVLMDIAMPDLNGLDACERIAREALGTKIILLSMYSAEDVVMRGFAAGAKGYMLKDAAPEEMELAIHAVARGGTFFSSQITGRNAAQLRDGVHPLQSNELSTRQREVLQMIAEGHPTREIAKRLYLSVKTIETHRTQIMHKLDIYDVAGLTRYAVRTGLITLGN